jgi:hypothetical protein
MPALPVTWDGLFKGRIDDLAAAGRLRIPRGPIGFEIGNANQRISGILSQIHRFAYAFVFVDPARPSQLPWSMVATIAGTAPPSRRTPIARASQCLSWR